MIKLFKKMITLQGAFEICGQWIPWLALFLVMCLAVGLVDGLVLAPADYQQGNAYRIMYVHVPSAMLAMSIYVVMALWAIMYWVWRIKLAAVALNISARIGAGMTFLALMTGAIWGKPMWGTWWVWDARLTSMLILLFLYLGIIALHSSLPEQSMKAKATSLLAIVGVINIPIIHYSVKWWNTLHQGSSFDFNANNIAASMLYPLIAMLLAFVCYYLLLLCFGMRRYIMTRHADNQWLKQSVMDGK